MSGVFQTVGGLIAQAFRTISIAMVGNAGAFSVGMNGSINLEISGVLTAPGAVTPTLAAGINDVLVNIDNTTTGSFPVTMAGITIPWGRSAWYWNGATFEMVAQYNGVRSATLDLTANQTIAQASTWTKLNMNTLAGAPAIQKGGIGDAVNGRLVIQEDGDYQIIAQMGAFNIGAVGGQTFQMALYRNGVSFSVSTPITVAQAFIGEALDAEFVTLNKGDIIELYGWSQGAGTVQAQVSDTFLSIFKIGSL